ncbi:MAG: SDR family NAD(P)-dependent oxidoreductase [Burkholderiaceae bacterium]
MNTPIQSWQDLGVWIVGASSGIGAALAKELARRGARLSLSARRLEAMQALGIEGAKLLPLDVCDQRQLEQACNEVAVQAQVDVVIWMAGIYRPVSTAQYQLGDMIEMTNTNYLSLLYALQHLLPYFLQRSKDPGKHSLGLAIVSSVAGYRGLPKALGYGPSKAALSHLAEVLHLELAPQGVGVWVVHPGFVETPATAINNFKMPALISAQQAAHEIVQGLGRTAFEIHFPLRFTRFMKCLRWLPDRLYFALLRRALGGTEFAQAKQISNSKA